MRLAGGSLVGVVVASSLLLLGLAAAAAPVVGASVAAPKPLLQGVKYTKHPRSGALVPDWSGATREEALAVCEQLRRDGAAVQCAHDNPARLGESVLARGKVKLGVSELDPVILLPGLGGSVLEAKLDKEDTPAWYCFKKWDKFFRLWLSLPELLVQDCWFDNLKVEYNASSNDYYNPQGVETRAADFGGVGGIDYLDRWFGFPVPLTGYYHSLIASLEKVGYRVGDNLFGAPYDWRVPTTDHELTEQKFYANFKALVESARAKNGGKKVQIVTHSMGGPTALRFFNLQTQAWLDENIASFLPIAAPWSGSPKALRAVLSGDDFGLNALGTSLINLDKVKDVARKAGGIIYLVPDPEFYTAGEVFVEGPGGKYTANQFGQLFEAINAPTAATIHARTKNILNFMRAPRTATHCIYGYGLPTEHFYNYTEGWDKQPVIVSDNNGDGTVPLESLQECKKWGTEQTQSVDHVEFDLVGHSAILEDQDVFDYIISVVAH